MLRARALTRQVLTPVLIALMAMLGAFAAKAHELRPAIAEISFPEGRYQIVIVMNLEALIAGVGPGHEDTQESPVAVDYNRLRAMAPEGLSSEYFIFEEQFMEGVSVAGDNGAALSPELVSLIVPPVGDLELARDSILTIGGVVPDDVSAMTFGWSRGFGPVVVRTVADENGEGYSAFLTNGEASEPIAVSRADSSFFGAIWRWVWGG